MSKIVRCVIYARYSTDMQNANSIRDQIGKCEAFAAGRGWTVIQRYDQRALSGSIRQRPGYQVSLAGVEAGLVDVILAEALDRYTRDKAEAAILLKRCDFRDVEIHTISEGRVAEIQVGMAGTMNALYVKELAKKTHRGLCGRIALGASAGGLSYGYRVPLAPNGLPAKGRLEIVPEEAAVILSIFAAYADGTSPLRIAADLNARGIASPSERHWKQNTINGNRKRGTGILNNELYVGMRVWNRLEYRKDPDTGRRVSRMRDESEWVRSPTPALRIVDDALWERVKARQDRVAKRLVGATDPNRASAAQGLRRRRHLLSGLLHCAKCGGRMTVANAGSAKAFYCAAAKEKGAAVCAGLPGLRLDRIQPAIFDSLRRRLMTPQAVAAFRTAFADKLAAMTSELTQDRAMIATELRAVDRKIETVKENLLRLAATRRGSDELLDTLVDAEARREALRERRDAITGELPTLPENLAELYAAKVEALVTTLSDPSLVHRANEALADIIDRIEIGWDGAAATHTVEVFSKLVELLGLSDRDRAEAYSGHESPLKLVAGAGFEPATFRL